MDPLELARWQFGITTVYHFLMVPLTIGLGIVVATLQTMWVRTGKEQYLRMTKFWAKLFLINFIMGVATGIVQEFQFGMAWSEYSRFVGDVFGAPLAMEALIAFFAESTFLGIWIFGWGRIRKGLHLAALWIAVIASVFSAFFILAANSWMQHPVGTEMIDGRPVMVDIWAVLGNDTLWAAFPHTIAGALAVAGGFLVGIAWWHLWRRRVDGIDSVDENGRVIVGTTGSKGRDEVDHKVWLSSLRWGGWIALVAFLGTAFTGHWQAQLMIHQQPMKMASAEAACHDGTAFSVLSIADLRGGGATTCDDIIGVFEIPGLLSYLAYSDFETEVKGVNTLIPEYQEKYGPHLPDDPMYGERAGAEINYLPIMEVTYWGFRLMITFGGLAALAAAIALWITRKGTVPESRWLKNLALLSIWAPFGANTAGWIFTEMGRQPFVVAPNPDGMDQIFMYTAAAVSPGVDGREILFSLIVLTGIYGVLLVVEVLLLTRYVRGGVPAGMPELTMDEDIDDEDRKDRDDVLAFAY
ncbi:cytochrome ubiquinol oxidase subunit I [Micrococcoides hystricis]|uniref:Cytochrome ubiquinol oxidase subunit I n=1 Tax=Micrococcoides hystricis TaxID=1572761 RepID=A0ABV6P6W4_9MICC